jgi:hypothetical protein
MIHVEEFPFHATDGFLGEASGNLIKASDEFT